MTQDQTPYVNKPDRSRGETEARYFHPGALVMRFDVKKRVSLLNGYLGDLLAASSLNHTFMVSQPATYEPLFTPYVVLRLQIDEYTLYHVFLVEQEPRQDQIVIDGELTPFWRTTSDALDHDYMSHVWNHIGRTEQNKWKFVHMGETIIADNLNMHDELGFILWNIIRQMESLIVPKAK